MTIKFLLVSIYINSKDRTRFNSMYTGKDVTKPIPWKFLHPASASSADKKPGVN
jgi:hypothetical protein